jgi:hypothetical protein
MRQASEKPMACHEIHFKTVQCFLS